MNQDGSEKEVYVDRPCAIRSAWISIPTTGELWTNDNQVDGMGDDMPPGELNRITGAGPAFRLPVSAAAASAFPTTRTASRRPTRCRRWWRRCRTPPISASLFYTGNKFPDKYKKGVFTAQHGSWNRTEPVGARVLFTPLNDDGTAAGEQEEFAVGWLNADGEYIGRPVDIAQLRDGSLLVSDDFAGAVYRISYSQ